ncbi:hypothetical protein [Pseudodesulfovibrio tunisiensis]|uniref:hypothetical protein n=1 Tax=Pseudodesulfovibrio tunisiensis TaxID=463192 RepID=UPI001FB3A21D|nr:hypothetical protein [Pseudodesulfovibrio tunisiensis]
MIILHNRQDRASREFLLTMPEAGHEIIEWYTEPTKVATYMAEHPGLSPSAFPSVVLPVPAYREPERTIRHSESPDDIESIPARDVPAHCELLRCPTDWAEVEARVKAEEERAAS